MALSLKRLRKTAATASPRTGRAPSPAPGSHLRSLFSPMALEFGRTSMLVGDRWTRAYLITALPPHVAPGWLAKAANTPGVTLALHAVPEDPTTLVMDLSRKIAQLAGQLETRSSALTQQRTAQQLHDAEALMRQLDAEQQGAFTTAVVLLVTAADETTGLQTARRVEGQLGAHGIRARTLSFRQEAGLQAAGPWGHLPPELLGDTPYVLPVSTLAASWPFSSGGINHGRGIALGQDDSHSLVLVDRWDPPTTAGITNKNWNLLGPSGGGKTFAATLTLLREYALGAKIYVLDPEKREYQHVCHHVGGHWLNAAGGRTRLNPFQARTTDRTEDSGLAALSLHIQWLLTFLHTLMPGLSPTAQALLAAAVRETYESAGIPLEGDPAGIPNDQWPHIDDLYRICQRHAAADGQEDWHALVALLQEPAVGTLAPLWAGPSTVPSTQEADFVVVDLMDLKDAPDNIKRAQYYNVLGYLWDLIRRDKAQRKILVADEAWILIDAQNPATLRFLKQVAKLIRGYNGSLMTITQNVFDFLAPAVRQDGEPVLTNAAITLFMRQNDRELQSLVELFRFSEEEQSKLSGALRGQGLLIAGNSRAWIEVQPSAYEENLIIQSSHPTV